MACLYFVISLVSVVFLEFPRNRQAAMYEPPGDTYLFAHFLGFTVNCLAVEG